MKRTITILCVMLCVTYSPSILAQQPELCKSTLTIGAYDLGDCGLLNSSETRTTNTPDEDEIAEKVREHIKAEKIGTGFIYTYNGKRYVITCEHVIFKAGTIYGYDADFKKYELDLVGGDTFYDLAVLEFKNTSEGKQFESVEFETQLPDTEERVQSMGFWNLDNTRLSFSGEVLGERIIPDDELPIPKLGFVEHTAKLPKGFSGGILVGEDNKVLGMNILRTKDAYYFYALKSSVVEDIVEDIIDTGKVQRAFTGIQFAQDTGSGGVIINEIISNSPAAKYRDQLEKRVIKKINSKAVYEIYDVLQIMENIRPDTPITIELDNNEYTIQSVPMEREQLRQIAENAVQYNKYIEIRGEAIIVNDNAEKVAKIAGKKGDLVYCLDSVEQFGGIVRIFGLHRQLRVSTHDESIKRAYKEIEFSDDGQLGVLYY